MELPLNVVGIMPATRKICRMVWPPKPGDIVTSNVPVKPIEVIGTPMRKAFDFVRLRSPYAEKFKPARSSTSPP